MLLFKSSFICDTIIKNLSKLENITKSKQKTKLFKKINYYDVEQCKTKINYNYGAMKLFTNKYFILITAH